MSGYIGQFLLMLASLNAFLGLSLRTRYISLHGTTLCLVLSLLWLIYGHVMDDFSLINVFLHSHTHKPLLYKIAGAWGNHEGSFLLWLTLLASCLSLAHDRLQSSIFETIAQLTLFAFLGFIILCSDPFTQHLIVRLEGRDLNPLLQDPLLAIHPPCLYLGYVCFAIPFLIAISDGFTNERHLNLCRQWSLIGWAWLTLGIVLGAFWAYYELGWGGWWAWDPVENAALIPWLSATAQIHILWLAIGREHHHRLAIILMALTWASCLAGTILVRSGLLTSVHSFAIAPERGILLTMIASFLVIAGAIALKRRFPAFNRQQSRNRLVFAIELGCSILLIGWFTVLLGTIYPLISELLGLPITVGTPYFELTFIPLMLPLFVLMAYLPDLMTPKTTIPSGLIMGGFALFLGYWLLEIHSLLSLLALLASVWLVSESLLTMGRNRQITAMGLAHGGLGLMIAAMILTTHLSQDLLIVLKSNHPISFATYDVELKDVVSLEGPNYTAQQAWIEIRQNNRLVTTLKPERRYYHGPQMVHGETALYSHGYHHLYAVLGEAYQDGQWSIHIYVKPWINVMIFGVIMMILGGFLSLKKRRSSRPSIQDQAAITSLLLALLSIPSLALEAHEKLPDHKLENAAKNLGDMLLCPTCSGQTLNDSPSPTAQELRHLIRTELMKGKTTNDIIENFKDRYGPQVYRTPPLQWGTWALWGLPWLAFLSIMGWQFSRHRQKFIS